MTSTAPSEGMISKSEMFDHGIPPSTPESWAVCRAKFWRVQFVFVKLGNAPWCGLFGLVVRGCRVWVASVWIRNVSECSFDVLGRLERYYTVARDTPGHCGIIDLRMTSDGSNENPPFSAFCPQSPGRSSVAISPASPDPGRRSCRDPTARPTGSPHLRWQAASPGW
jgi:hypothetical protein